MKFLIWASVLINTVLAFNHPGLGLSGKHTTGYLDIGNNKEMFFWLVDSSKEAAKDPLVVWLSGGPGCSSAFANLYENGPSYISASGSLKPRYSSWNNGYNVLYIDAPAGSGLSLSKTNVTSTDEVVGDLEKFMTKFYSEFPQFKGRDLHLTGESYAGRYIPNLALKINVTSIVLGNPLVDLKHQAPMVYATSVASGQLNSDQLAKVQKAVDKCNKEMEKCYNSSFKDCSEASVACQIDVTRPYTDAKLDTHDMRNTCPDTIPMCKFEMEDTAKWLLQNDTLEAIGSKVAHPEGCSNTVYQNFLESGDFAKPTSQVISKLLDKQVPIMVYAGNEDFLNGFLGQMAWIDALNGTFINQWRASWPFGDLKINTKPVGVVKNMDHFTVVRVDNSGHMAPRDQGIVVKTMLDRWVSKNRPLTDSRNAGALQPAIL